MTWLHDWRVWILVGTMAAFGCGTQAEGGGPSVAGAGAGSASGGNSGVGGSGSGGSGVTVGGGVGGGATSHSLTIGPFSVPPGDEMTMCTTIDAGNAAGILRKISTHLTEGSHHMIVTKVNEGGEQPPTPCGAFAHGGDALFIAEKKEMALVYPDGTGLPFAANQLIGLELHFINYNAQPLEIEGVVDFDLVEPDDSLSDVHLLFDGNLGLSIPPNSQKTFTSNHSLPAGAKVFAVTSHTHRLGVYASIHKTTSGADELLHESDSWAEPPFDVFAPPLIFGAGENLRLRCDYNNTTNDTVSFGTGFYDEMCFLWAHYTLD